MPLKLINPEDVKVGMVIVAEENDYGTIKGWGGAWEVRQQDPGLPGRFRVEKMAPPWFGFWFRPSRRYQISTSEPEFNEHGEVCP